MRRAKGERRQSELHKQWDPSENKWQKYARCALCGGRYVCNNYADRKARVSQDKVRGKIICAWCRGRPLWKRQLSMMLLAEAVARMECVPGDWLEGCRCPPCVARRLTGST